MAYNPYSMTPEEQAAYAADGSNGAYSPQARSDYYTSEKNREDAIGMARAYADWVKANKIGGVYNERYYLAAKSMAENPSHIQAEFMPRQGENEAAWMERIGRGLPGFADFLKSNNGYQHFKSMTWGPTGPDGKPLDQSAQTANPGKDDVMAKIRAFADALTKPLDINDPEYKAIITQAENRASDRARLQGIQGPISNANTQQMGMTAGMGFNEQRKQMGLSALGLLNEADMGRQQLGLQQKQFEAQQLAARRGQDLGMEAMYREQQAAPWRTLGNVVGTVGSAVGGIVTGGMGLAAGLAGTAANAANSFANRGSSGGLSTSYRSDGSYGMNTGFTPLGGGRSKYGGLGS
jgi:hypothetical protein